MNGDRISLIATEDVGDILDNQVVDHFSGLPDTIITRIFSFLPMREALGICILSNKLRHLWTMIPNLEFKESVDDSLHLSVDAKKRDLVRVIDRFLEHHDGPIQSFRLSFYPGWYRSDIFRWICVVMQSGVEELDLNFLPNLGMPIQLPSSLLNCGTLKVLKIRSCILDSPLGFVGFSSLNSLFLGDVSLCDDMIRSLLCQCGLLRSLTLQNCYGFQIIKVTDINAQLESLSLENCHSLLNLCAPRLKTLYYCSEKIKVFVIEASQVKKILELHKSSTSDSRPEIRSIRSRVLDKLSFSADDELEEHRNLEYQGIVKLELETSFRGIKELHGHAWLLRSACLEKVILKISSDAFPNEGYF